MKTRAPFRPWIIPLLGLALLTLTGCVRRDTQGTRTTYSYEKWVFWAQLGTGLVLAATGMAMRKKAAIRFLFFFGGGAMVIFSPNFLQHQFEVDFDHVKNINGWWWRPTRTYLEFANMTEIRRVVETHGNIFKTPTPYKVYVCTMKSGATERIPRGELVGEAEDQFLQAAFDKGVLVSGEWTEVPDRNSEQTTP